MASLRTPTFNTFIKEKVYVIKKKRGNYKVEKRLPWSDIDEVFRFILRKVVGQELFIFGDSWKVLLRGCPQDLENVVELVLDRRAGKQGATAGHLVENTAYTPDKYKTCCYTIYFFEIYLTLFNSDKIILRNYSVLQ